MSQPSQAAKLPARLKKKKESGNGPGGSHQIDLF
jgi:hypothetical protein